MSCCTNKFKGFNFIEEDDYFELIPNTTKQELGHLIEMMMDMVLLLVEGIYMYVCKPNLHRICRLHCAVQPCSVHLQGWFVRAYSSSRHRTLPTTFSLLDITTRL